MTAHARGGEEARPLRLSWILLAGVALKLSVPLTVSRSQSVPGAPPTLALRISKAWFEPLFQVRLPVVRWPTLLPAER